MGLVALGLFAELFEDGRLVGRRGGLAVRLTLGCDRCAGKSQQDRAKPQACVHTHSLYGNTASTAWALALDDRLRHGTVNAGDKIVIGSAAAGFTITVAAAEWEC